MNGWQHARDFLAVVRRHHHCSDDCGPRFIGELLVLLWRMAGTIGSSGS